MGTIFFVVLSLLAGILFGRIGMKLIDEFEDYLPSPPPLTSPPRTTEELATAWNGFQWFSSVVGALVAIVWSLFAYHSGNYAWAVAGALLGGWSIPVFVLAIVLIIGGIYNSGSYFLSLGNRIDGLYERVKAWVTRSGEPMDDTRRYFDLVARKGIDSPEAEAFVSARPENAALQDLAATLKKQESLRTKTKNAD